jgi:hypothetical protein
MSNMTLAQIAEKPITVATDEAISSFADSRHGLRAGSVPAKPVSAACFRRPNGIVRSNLLQWAGNLVAALNRDSDAVIS